MKQPKQVRTFQNWDSQVVRLPVEEDLKTMIDSYWETFSRQFPEVSLEDFAKWVQEDIYGGWEEQNHPHAGGRRELKMLYVTVRASKPKHILEIGTSDGTSANHLLLAAERNTEEGYVCQVTTLDITDYVNEENLHAYPLTRLIESSAIHLGTNTHYDFIFQDGDHSPEAILSELNLLRTLPNLQILFSHDYFLYPNITDTFNAFPSQEIFSSEAAYKEKAYRAGFYIGRV